MVPIHTFAFSLPTHEHINGGSGTLGATVDGWGIVAGTGAGAQAGAAVDRTVAI